MSNIDNVLEQVQRYENMKGDTAHIHEVLTSAKKGDKFLLFVYKYVMDISRVNFVLSKQTVDYYNHRNAERCYLIEVEDQLNNIGVFHINCQNVQHFIEKYAYDVEAVNVLFDDGTASAVKLDEVLINPTKQIVDILPIESDTSQFDEIQFYKRKIKKLLYDLRIKPTFINQYKN